MPDEQLELIKNLMWIPMGVAVLGTVLNARKNIVCFPIWIVSNIALVIMNSMIEVYAMAGLFVVYTFISAYGWHTWAALAGETATGASAQVDEPSKCETVELPEGSELGRIKWYNKKKGFGFIIADADKREIFFHQTEIDMPGFRIVQEDQQVSFKTINGDRGEEGRQIKPI